MPRARGSSRSTVVEFLLVISNKGYCLSAFVSLLPVAHRRIPASLSRTFSSVQQCSAWESEIPIHFCGSTWEDGGEMDKVTKCITRLAIINRSCWTLSSRLWITASFSSEKMGALFDLFGVWVDVVRLFFFTFFGSSGFFSELDELWNCWISMSRNT